MKWSANPILPPATTSVSILIGTFSAAEGGEGGAAGEAASEPDEEAGGSSGEGEAVAAASPPEEAAAWTAAGAGAVPRTRARLVVPSGSIATSSPSPAKASREISRVIGLNEARIPSAEKLSHFRKSRFVARSSTRKFATRASPW